jgi:hypothetical protein
VVLTRLVAGRMSADDAALVLGLSLRSIRRLRSAFVARGPAALVHGNRGRAVAHRLDPALVERVVAFARDREIRKLDQGANDLAAADS